MNTQEIKVDGYEKVVYAEEPKVGLRAIIAIHNTNRGNSCGGVRILPYASREEAMEDVLRLSRGMSYKSALAGIGFGGGKSVIILDPAKKTPALMHVFGEFVESFGGKYIAAKDMNISSEDLLQIREKTKHVLGIDGVPGSSGDPSPVTSRGILRALEATAEELTGRPTLSGLRIAIQGVGHVGYGVAEFAVQQGAQVWVSDVNPAAVAKAVKELGVSEVSNESITSLSCDIFSPCARGAILNRESIEQLRCRAVVGAANNQLATDADGFRLHEKGILYAPDYAVNAGGIINIYIEHEGYDQAKAFAKADEIYKTLREVYTRARAAKTAPFVIADKLAEERLYGSR